MTSKSPYFNSTKGEPHTEQKGWSYLIFVKEKYSILSGLTLPDVVEFYACFSYSLSKHLPNRNHKESQKYCGLPGNLPFDYQSRIYFQRHLRMIAKMTPVQT